MQERQIQRAREGGREPGRNAGWVGRGGGEGEGGRGGGGSREGRMNRMHVYLQS